MSRIYLSPPHVGERERELLLAAYDSNWIAPLGPHVDSFERELAAYVGVGHAAALSSGTAALHLALLLLGVERGQEVLCSTLTFAATANAICYVGARPIFVDADSASWNLDPELVAGYLELAAAQNRLPAAMIAVDLYGQCADYAALGPICAQYGVPIIEDAAEALGATCNGRGAGSFGALGVLSFNGNKIITTSGGGALLSDNAEWIERARFLATQARDPAPHYQHSTVGYNYRMSNLLAAVGRGQLESLDSRVDARRAVNQRYREAFAGVPGITFLPEAAYGRSNCWLTCVLIDADAFGVDRESVRLALEREDIEARPVWKPMHLQPVFDGLPVLGGQVAERLFRDGLCLPSGSSLSVDDQARVTTTMLETAGVNQ